MGRTHHSPEAGGHCLHGGQRFCKLFETASDAIVFYDHRNGRFVDFNDAALRLYGYTRDGFMKLKLSDLSAEPRAAAAAYKAVRAGKAGRIPMRLHKRKDGTVFPAEVVTSAGRLPPELPQFAIVRDISERVKAQEGAQRLAAIVEATHDAVLSIDLKGTIKTWNPGARRMFGFAPSEAIGRHITMLAPPGRAKEAMPLARASIKKGQSFLETVRLRKDGGLIDVSVNVSPMRDGRGALTGFCGVLRDITGLKATRRAVIASEERERGRIGRELHDGVGQILSGIKFRLQSLPKELSRSRPAAVRALRQVAGQLDEAIAEIRRTSQNLVPPELKALGLKDALGYLCRTFQQRSRVRVDFRCPGCRAQLDGQTSLAMFRICQEALSNVEKHARARRVLVSLRRVDHSVELVVADDGRGWDRRRSKRMPGVGGAGLVNIRERAESLGGTVEILSRPGHGTKVAIRLPISSGNSSS